MGNYVSGVGNYLSAKPSDLGNYVSADKLALIPVQPAVQVPAHLKEHARISVRLHRPDVPASQPRQ